jgi:divalent metal cation (Fe/Co/Zn/Cd) transporter
MATLDRLELSPRRPVTTKMCVLANPSDGTAFSGSSRVPRDKVRAPSWLGIGLTAGTLVICPWLGRAKQRIGEKLGSRATYGEGTQNVLCAILASAVLVGLAANTLFGLWWLDPAIALVISAICVREGQKAWRGEECGCATCS